MTKKIISPCKEICRYEQINGKPRCISCFRTYEDLSNWIYLTDEEQRNRVKQIKKERKDYERQQQNDKHMEKKS